MTAFIAIVLIVLLGVALFVLLSGIALYARVVKLRTAVVSSRAEIDNALKKRYDDLSAAVRDYNAAVRDYNFEIESFPLRLVAKRCGLEKAEFYY